MGIKLNIAEILKDKPEGTKLYSPLFGDVYLSYVKDGIINVQHHGGITKFFDNGRYYNYSEAEPLLFPSKEMQDWCEFAWKKGDVLVSKGRGILHVIFEGFNDDTYTTFKGKHYLWDYADKEDYDDEEDYNDYHKEVNERTIEFEKDNVNNAKTHINTIEKRFGGKLNLETLEIEKTQPELKDGDIVTQGVLKGVNVYIIKNCIDKIDNKYNYYARYNTQDKEINYDDWSHLSPFAKFATNSEKQQLFDALAKEGKRWDAEKKLIVDLKPKVRFKPFDRVVTYGEITHEWSCDIFSHYAKNYEGKEVITCLGGGTYYKALPYNEETAKLLGTTKDVEG